MSIRLGFLVMAVMFGATPATEGRVYWGTTIGDWSVSANWGGTKPTVGIDAAIYNDGIATITSFGEACGQLALGNSGLGRSGTVQMSGGSLSASQEYIGAYGRGTFTQTGGTNTVTGDLCLGYGSGSSGIYDLNGGTLVIQSIRKGSGAAAFNFGDGTLKANAAFSTTVPMDLSGTANVDTAGYAVTFSGGLSGFGSLNKLGSNTLTLSGLNNYSNGTTINSGNLAFSSTSAIPDMGNITINSSGALNVAGAYTTVAEWLGSHAINSDSTGALALTASNSDTINMDGYANLSLGAAGNYTFNGAMTPASNTYRFGGGGGTITVSSNLSGERSLVVNGSVSLTGANEYTGNTNMNQGMLSISSTAALPGWNTAGRYTVAPGAVLAIGSGITSAETATILGTGNFRSGSAIGFDTYTFDGSALPSTVGLTKFGTGTLTLSKALANTTGAVTVTGGILDLGGFSQEIPEVLVLQSGTLRNGTLWKNGGNFEFQAGTVSANLADGTSAAGLVKSGTGTLNLQGNNTFSGGVTLAEGRLDVSSATALGTGTFTIGGGDACVINSPLISNLTLSTNNAMVWNGDFTHGDKNSNNYSLNLGNGPVTLGADCVVTTTSRLTVGGAIRGDHSLTITGGGALTLTGVNTFTGGLTLEDGELAINSSQALGNGMFTMSTPNMSVLRNTSSGAITLSNNNPIVFDASSVEFRGRGLDFGSGPVALSGTNHLRVFDAQHVTIGGAISGNGQLLIEGSSGSEMTLAGNNTYSGGTLVGSYGCPITLTAANDTGSATGSGPVIVYLWGTLSGSGSIAGPVTVAGTLAPGNSPGILTIDNQVTLQTDSTFDIEIMGLEAGSGYDQLLTTGPVSLAGSLSASFGSFAPTGHDTLFVLNNTGSEATTGTFQYADNAKIGRFNGVDWYITYDANNAAVPSLNGGNDVAIYSVPEPSSLVLLSVGAASLGAYVWRRRKQPT